MARERDVDDGYDDGPARPGAMGPLDNMYRNTNVVVLVLFGLCCGIVAFILSLIAYLTAKDPKAKSNALLVLIIGIVQFAVAMVLNFAGLLGGMAGR